MWVCIFLAIAGSCTGYHKEDTCSVLCSITGENESSKEMEASLFSPDFLNHSTGKPVFSETVRVTSHESTVSMFEINTISVAGECEVLPSTYLVRVSVKENSGVLADPISVLPLDFN
jgi:hypothetical protein